MFESLRADLRRHFTVTGSRSPLGVAAAFFEMSLWAIGIFRFGKWAHSFRARAIRWPLMTVYFFLYRLSQALSGISISLDSEIEPGLVIHNYGGVIIHGRVGKDCIFVQGAQMISRADGKARGWPWLGDRVYVGAGAKILGDVRVGDGAQIGANAVVMADVPEGAIVMPPECRTITGFRAAAPTVKTESGPLRDRVARMLEETVCRGRRLPADDSASLLECGLLDSLGILTLAEEVKTRFGCVVTNEDLTPENLDSIGALTSFLLRHGVPNTSSETWPQRSSAIC
jgi:serine O-acetyltransferase